MKKFILSIAFLSASNLFSQAYDGYADTKSSLGATFQKGAIGAMFNFDRGITDYISYGTSFGLTISSDPPEPVYFMLNDDKIENKYSKEELISEKIDFNVRLNGHFGKLIGLGEMADIFAGPNVSFRAFGAQAGARFMISDSFGFFAEGNVPIKKFSVGSFYSRPSSDSNDNVLPYYEQPVFGIGIIISQ